MTRIAFFRIDNDIEILKVAERLEPFFERDHERTVGTNQMIGIRVEDEIGRRVPGGGGRHQGGDQQHSPGVIHDDRRNAIGGSLASPVE